MPGLIRERQAQATAPFKADSLRDGRVVIALIFGGWVSINYYQAARTIRDDFR